MTAAIDQMRIEVDKNFLKFSERVDEYLQLYPNRFALMRSGEVVEFYQSWEDAYRTGLKFYPDGIFSVQAVTKSSVDLGYFSHAVHIG